MDTLALLLWLFGLHACASCDSVHTLLYACCPRRSTVQLELRKTNTLRDRLEELSRQLQRENKEVLEESRRRKEEEMKQRQALQQKFSQAINVRAAGGGRAWAGTCNGQSGLSEMWSGESQLRATECFQLNIVLCAGAMQYTLLEPKRARHQCAGRLWVVVMACLVSAMFACRT